MIDIDYRPSQKYVETLLGREPNTNEPDIDFAYNFITHLLTTKLDQRLTYHGVGHTIEVTREYGALAEESNLTSLESLLGISAALIHDAGFLDIGNYEKNEPIAVQIMRLKFPEWGYKSTHLDIIEGIVLSTQMDAAPKGILQEIMHDSDFRNLRSVDCFARSEDYRRELATFTGREFSDKDWYGMVADLLERPILTNHAKLYGLPQKEQNLEMARRLRDAA